MDKQKVSNLGSRYLHKFLARRKPDLERKVVKAEIAIRAPNVNTRESKIGHKIDYINRVGVL